MCKKHPDAYMQCSLVSNSKDFIDIMFSNNISLSTKYQAEIDPIAWCDKDFTQYKELFVVSGGGESNGIGNFEIKISY